MGMNVQLHGKDSTGLPEAIKSTSNAAHTFEQGLGAGERNVDSATNGYQVIRNECNADIISKTTAVTIGGGAAADTHLIGIMIHTALTGTCAIAGFADSDGNAINYTFPAATPAGFYDFKGAINDRGALTVTCPNAADDNLVMVLWKAV